jgi:hypothetical protein
LTSHSTNTVRLAPLLAVVLFLVCGIVPGLTTRAAPAADLSASVFYTTTTAAYDTWNADSSDSPPQPAHTAGFAAGTRTVGFYFEYDEASAGSTSFTIIIKNAAGTVFVNSEALVADYASGAEMKEVDAPSGAYPAGMYTATLTADEAQVANTTFSVSGSASAKAKPAAILFYATSKTWYDWWVSASTKKAPSKWTRFVPGTSTVAFYFSYTNILPKSTTFQIAVYDEGGQVYAHDAQFTRSYKAGSSMTWLKPDSDNAYQDGTYTAVLWMNGHTTLRTTFNVMAAG